jgi:hypothetical protein
MLDVGKEEQEYDGWKDAETKMYPMGITKRVLKRSQGTDMARTEGYEESRMMLGQLRWPRREMRFTYIAPRSAKTASSPATAQALVKFAVMC